MAIAAVVLGLGCSGRRGDSTASPAAVVGQDRAPALDERRLLGLLGALADDALGGRYTLHEDIDRAAEAIITRYRQAGVVPAGEQGYRREFEIVVGVDPGPGTAVTLGGGRTAIDLQPKALLPLPEGAAGDVEGPLVFVGYGIARTSADAGAPFDELAGVPLDGAVAVILAGAPRRPANATTGARGFGRRDRSLGRKLERLAEAKVAAVIVVDDPAALEAGSGRAAPDLPASADDRPMRRRVAIPVLQLHATEAQAGLRAGGRTLGALQFEIDRAGQPRSRSLGRRARVVVDAEPRVARAPNILAMVPGTDLADEIVLVGAHYDHIGTDAPGHGHCRQLRGTDDAICNGADDNASGSAIVAELAQVMTAGPAPRRTVVFVHFSGEEMGLLGSRDLAARLDTVPPFAGRRVVAMLNIDMVGRLRERLTISGVGSSAAWMGLLDEIGPRGMRVLYDRALTERSDHAPFYERGIPSLFFFTELHADYHAPGDELGGIVSEGLMQVAGLVAEVTWRVADGAALPFQVPEDPAQGLVRALPGEDPGTIVKVVGPDGQVEGG
ncbi:MAG: M28 family peptidase [Myxococcota bacterium]